MLIALHFISFHLDDVFTLLHSPLGRGVVRHSAALTCCFSTHLAKRCARTANPARKCRSRGRSRFLVCAAPHNRNCPVSEPKWKMKPCSLTQGDWQGHAVIASLESGNAKQPPEAIRYDFATAAVKDQEGQKAPPYPSKHCRHSCSYCQSRLSMLPRLPKLIAGLWSPS